MRRTADGLPHCETIGSKRKKVPVEAARGVVVAGFIAIVKYGNVQVQLLAKMMIKL